MKGVVSLGLVLIVIAAACGTDSKKAATPAPATPPTSTATGTLTGNATTGGTFYSKQGCVACHSFTSPFGSAAVDITLTSVADFTTVLKDGTKTAKGTMVAYPTDAQGVADVMAYVKSQKK